MQHTQKLSVEPLAESKLDIANVYIHRKIDAPLTFRDGFKTVLGINYFLECCRGFHSVPHCYEGIRSEAKEVPNKATRLCKQF